MPMKAVGSEQALVPVREPDAFGTWNNHQKAACSKPQDASDPPITDVWSHGGHSWAERIRTRLAEVTPFKKLKWPTIRNDGSRRELLSDSFAVRALRPIGLLPNLIDALGLPRREKNKISLVPRPSTSEWKGIWLSLLYGNIIYVNSHAEVNAA